MKTLLFAIFCLPFFVTTPPKQKPGPYDFEAGEKGLSELGKYLMDANFKERIRLTYELLPQKSEYASVFQEDVIRQIQRYHKKWYRKTTPAIGPQQDEESELRISWTSPEELLAYTGEGQHFPGGYREMAAYFLPDLQLYRLQYLVPGSRVGSSFEVFIYLEDHWRVFPHPWKAWAD